MSRPGLQNPNQRSLNVQFSSDSLDLSDHSFSEDENDNTKKKAPAAPAAQGMPSSYSGKSFKGFIARSMSGISDHFGTGEGSPQQRPARIERQPSKLRRTLSNIGEHYKDLIGSVSYFQDWSRTELINVLVDHGVEVRNEHHLSIDTLRDIADEAFEEFITLPDRPKGHTLAELRRLDAAAARIQEVWFQKKKMLDAKAKKAKKFKAKQKKHYIQRSSSHVEDIQDVVESTPENNFSMYADMARQSYAFDDEEAALHLAPSAASADEEAGQSDAGEGIGGIASLKMKMALEQPYVPPSFEFAQHFADLTHPRRPNATRDRYSVVHTSTGRHCMQGGMGEICDYWEEKQVSELSQFGPGVTNYYKFLKWCFWIFVILATVYSFAFCANTFGNAFKEEFSVIDISLGSVAHLGGFGENSTIAWEVPPDLCEMNVFNHDCTATGETAAYMYSAITAFATIVLVIGYMWLRSYELHEERVWNESSVSAGSYSVVVYNLPKDVTTIEIRAHFANVINESVVDVTLAYDNEYEIGMYMKRGDLVKNRYTVTQEYRYYQAMKSNKDLQKKAGKDSASIERALADIAKKRAALTDEIIHIDQAVKMHEDESAKKKSGPIAAFVTFDGPMAREKALRTYGRAWFGYFYTRPFLRLKGKNIVLEGAPEPSTIIWENLAYTYKTRTIFRFFTFLVSIFLLAISAVVSYAPTVLGNLASNRGGSAECPADFDNWSSGDQKDYAIVNSGAVHCYCDNLDFFDQAQEPVCEAYFRAQLLTQIIIYGAACVVLIINAVIDYAIRVCARWEKHHTVEAMERAIFIRMWFAKIINTGLTFIFASNYSLLGPYVPFELPRIDVFSQDWFQTVGVNIVLVQIGNILTIHAVKTAKYIYMHYRLWKARRGTLLVLTQDELNMMHMGPDFILSRRYAQVLADMTVCLLFTSGIPILAAIAAFNFYVSYWIDKFMLLRFYRTPPRFNAEIGKLATRLIPLAIIGHLLVAIWMYGSTQILSTPQTGQQIYHHNVDRFDAARLRDKLNDRHIFGLIGVLVIVVVGVIIDEFLRNFIGLLRVLMRGACGSYCNKSEYHDKFESFLNSHVQVKYSRALTRGLIKGLTNYNILQNPIYKHAFNISDEFAENHKSLKSIRERVKFSYFGEDKINEKMPSFDENGDQAADAEQRRKQFASAESQGSSSFFDLNYLINPATAAAAAASAAPTSTTTSATGGSEVATPRNRLADIAAAGGAALSPRDTPSTSAQQRKSITRPPEAGPADVTPRRSITASTVIVTDSSAPISGDTPKAQQRKSITRPVPPPISTAREDPSTQQPGSARRHSVRQHEDHNHGGIPLPSASATPRDDRRKSIKTEDLASVAAAAMLASAADAKRRGSHRSAHDGLDHSETPKSQTSPTALDPSVPFSAIKHEGPRNDDPSRGQRKSYGFNDPRPSPVSSTVRNSALDILSGSDSSSPLPTPTSTTAKRNSLRADESLVSAPIHGQSPAVGGARKTYESSLMSGTDSRLRPGTPESDVPFSARYSLPNRNGAGPSPASIPATTTRQSLGESIGAPSSTPRTTGISAQLHATLASSTPTTRSSLRANDEALMDAPAVRRGSRPGTTTSAPVVPALNLSSVLGAQQAQRLTPRMQEPSPRQGGQDQGMSGGRQTPTAAASPARRGFSNAAALAVFDARSDSDAKEYEI